MWEEKRKGEMTTQGMGTEEGKEEESDFTGITMATRMSHPVFSQKLRTAQNL